MKIKSRYTIETSKRNPSFFSSEGQGLSFTGKGLNNCVGLGKGATSQGEEDFKGNDELRGAKHEKQK